MNNLRETEKGLKRWLKSKVSITMATVVGFMIAGSVSFADTLVIDKDYSSSDDLNIEVIGGATEKPFYTPDSNKFLIGIQVNPDSNRKTELTGENIIVNIEENIGDGNAYGVFAPNGDTTLGSEGTKIDIVVKSTKTSANGITMLSTKTNNNYKPSTLAETDEELLVINGKELNINAEGAKYSSGIYLVGANKRIVVNSENTTINVTSGTNNGIGISATSNSKVEVNGNLEVNADIALEINGNNAQVDINKTDDKTIKLTGDIINSNKTSEGGLTLNLSNSESYLNGNIENSSGTVNLGVSNGAQWNTNVNSRVTTLAFNDGIINVNGGNNHTVQIDKVVGNGGTVNIKTTDTGNGFNAGIFTVKEANKGTSLDVNFTGITADDISTKEFKELAEGHVTGEGLGNLDTTVKVEEGLTEGAITGELGANGVTNIKQDSSQTTTVSGLQALSVNTYIAWKQEMNSLNKRMGELRDSTGNHGVWARVYAGKSEYTKGYENEYQTYQVGYDKKYSVNNGTAFLGYLVSYTQGDSDYNHNSYGTGENKSIGAGVYGTWLGNSGDYIDVIFKVSNLENDYDVASLSGIKSQGDYDTLGFSLSTEYGKRFNLNEKFFLEPSAQLSLGRVNSVNYTASSGLEVKQDTIYSAEGKVGTALGYSFNKGNVYVRAAGVKEFAGEIDTTINGEKFEEDLGDSWLEFGVGINYRLQENLNLYVDFEKTGSAEVETDWQANLGIRYEF